MVKIGEIVMILDLHRQGLSVSAIARQSGIDRRTVHKYIERGLAAPVYGPRKPRETVIDPFTAYLRERVTRYPGLTGMRLFRELKKLGYGGGYTAVADFLRDVRPAADEAPGDVPCEVLYDRMKTAVIWRTRDRRRRLQTRTRRFRAPLRLSSKGLPALSHQDEG